MVKAPQALKEIWESEALGDLAPCTAVAVAVAVTTAAVVVEQIPTHAAPMPVVVAVDLHTPIQV
jgi:hypothetical protein